MNIQEYIESGILETYLAGELDHEEMLAVDKMAAQHPEISEELTRLRESIVRYARVAHKEPGRRVLTHVLNAIEEEEKGEEKPAPGKPLGSTGNSNSPGIFSTWSMAATFLLLVSIGFNFYFFSELQNAEGLVKELAQEKTFLSERAKTATQQLDHANLRIAHFLNGDNIHVRMDGSEISPSSFANVFWNRKTNAVFISVDNLPEPPHGHQYQLWAIKEGQPPIDAGIFDHNALVQELKVIRGEVRAFAVTLEKEGGTQYATVEKTYVKGFLKKS